MPRRSRHSAARRAPVHAPAHGPGGKAGFGIVYDERAGGRVRIGGRVGFALDGFFLLLFFAGGALALNGGSRERAHHAFGDAIGFLLGRVAGVAEAAFKLQTGLAARAAAAARTSFTRNHGSLGVPSGGGAHGALGFRLGGFLRRGLSNLQHVA